MTYEPTYSQHMYDVRSQGVPFPVGAWDRLRYFIVALSFFLPLHPGHRGSRWTGIPVYQVLKGVR